MLVGGGLTILDRRFAPFLSVAVLAVAIVGAAVANLDNGSREDSERLLVLKSGVSGSGRSWQLRHQQVNGYDCLGVFVGGVEVDYGCGFGVPDATEIGFAAGLKPGEGDYYLYGLTSARIASIRAESQGTDSEVLTERLDSVVSGSQLRFFIIVREPVDDVEALVGLDDDRRSVQRIELPD